MDKAKATNSRYIPRSSLDAPLTMYTRSAMALSSETRFMIANPMVVRGDITCSHKFSVWF